MAADNVTLLLRKWSEGDESALEELTPLVYDELHRLAINTCAVSRRDTFCKRRP